MPMVTKLVGNLWFLLMFFKTFHLFFIWFQIFAEIFIDWWLKCYAKSITLDEKYKTLPKVRIKLVLWHAHNIEYSIQLSKSLKKMSPNILKISYMKEETQVYDKNQVNVNLKAQRQKGNIV